MPKAYFNENDPYAAQWLRNLIAAGHIAPGEVDQRSIEDVKPSDLAGFTQCHFFAGIGVWSYALRRAGWGDSRPVWTGSCPCQPFSQAGQGNGFADERHLWPAWFHLIGQRSPVVVFGEQVSSKDADIWVDLVQTDMEALGYAFGAVPFPSAGVGAPHIRDRLYWLADSDSQRQPWVNALLHRDQSGRVAQNSVEVARGRQIERVDNTNDAGLERFGSGHKTEGGRFGEVRPVAPARFACRVDHTNGEPAVDAIRAGRQLHGVSGVIDATPSTGPVNGRWSDADWLFCRDGKWRPVEPGTFPLAHGAPARVGRLRAYGNAINAAQAQAFIETYLECRP